MEQEDQEDEQEKAKEMYEVKIQNLKSKFEAEVSKLKKSNKVSLDNKFS